MRVERAEGEAVAINKADVRIVFLVVVELLAERLEFGVFHCHINDARMSRLRSSFELPRLVIETRCKPARLSGQRRCISECL